MNEKVESGQFALSVDAFVRTIGVSVSPSRMFFLGSGASISSGVPGVSQCIWEWKREIYVTNNPTLSDHVKELSLPSVRTRIQTWLDTQGTYPPRGSNEEYAIYIEKCFPLQESRRAFFAQKIAQASPHIGYRLLGLLAEGGIFNTVWTTNFDCLAARAAANCKITSIEVGIDCKERLPHTPKVSELMSVYLHGDYRYDYIKNTAAETQVQENELLSGLEHECKGRDLVVCGYGGNDVALYEHLTSVYSTNGDGALFWCGIEDCIPTHVAALLQKARLAGRTAYYVPVDSFDDLLIRIAHHCLKNDHLARVAKIMEDLSPKSQTRSPFTLVPPPITKILKSNFFSIELPTEVYSLRLKKLPDKSIWKWVVSTARQHNFSAVPFKGNILAIGTLDAINNAFPENISGAIDRVPLTERDLRHFDGAIVSLLQSALLHAIAQFHGISTSGRAMLWDSRSYKSSVVKGQPYRIHEAAIISLRYLKDHSFLAVQPSCYLLTKNAEPVTSENNKIVKAQLLAGQYNEQYSTALDFWRKLLFPQASTTFECPPNSASHFKFVVKKNQEFVGVGGSSLPRQTVAGDKLKVPIARKGIVVDEPDLLFSDSSGKTRPLDIHPIRGLINNRPFDFALTQTGLSPRIDVSVICPKAESENFSAFLQRVLRNQSPADSERDYLPNYTGFQSAFAVTLNMPTHGDSSWHVLQEPAPAGTDEKTCVQLASAINRAIEQVVASSNPSVVIICVPSRWENLKRFDNGTERFDLHDFVKAYCVMKGIATQFIEESTIIDQQQCRVWWWLSLALYVKAMRTPWVLNGLSTESAFVGIGYSLDHHTSRSKQIIVGCSHIYNSDGQGLQFRLSKIDNPIFRNRNPFLNTDDARRLGETIRQLFFDAQHLLPKRVVIHKRTPFIESERDGLYQGLEGVQNLEFVELNEDPPYRFINSHTSSQGMPQVDRFPLERGTLVVIDDYSALLWIHGATQALNPKLRYYQGKRRIPAPILINRHSGHGDLTLIAKELLGLSKMNWNSFDMYSRMPATVHSSSHIARIGALLERFGTTAYDYRLFI